MSEKQEWYLQYRIHRNRPGLLGDISSLIGMLNINIKTINGVDNAARGMLLEFTDEKIIDQLVSILEKIEHISIERSRTPTLRDRLALQHGCYIERDGDDRNTFRFIRSELGILVDFMAELYKKPGHRLIGIRGLPRVGKTESIVAASVCANKRWLFVSSTLIKQTVRNQLIHEEYNDENVYIVDGIVTSTRASEQHWQLVRELMQLPAVKVIEHPDIFVQHSEYELSDFDYIIELRNHNDEQITYETSEDIALNQKGGFGAFDF